ncbi:elongation of very long chain fatty acids protein 4 [Platysternon megacephalum]|uniref:Elongation of very long chain fatty acids protein 4 n=1 Tax=Platysternon megacephalum TaxID=55544 RepID=A0A4D9F3X0_9SAUR|nr:elongation of very long chain fatty acids protein 4 [Platysternon megacephalum]
MSLQDGKAQHAKTNIRLLFKRVLYENIAGIHNLTPLERSSFRKITRGRGFQRKAVQISLRILLFGQDQSSTLCRIQQVKDTTGSNPIPNSTLAVVTKIRNCTSYLL